MDLAALLAQHELVDLSKRIGVGNATGPAGVGQRKFETRRFTYPPGEIMHEIAMESHIGTHVEAPSHYVDARYADRKGKDISEISLERLHGEACLVDLRGLGPGEAVTAAVMERSGVREGDIVLIGNSRHERDDKPYIAEEAARWLAARRPKCAGIDDTVFPEEPRYLFKELDHYFTHDYLLSADIPFIEGLANLGALKRPRFYFFGFVAPVVGLEAFPIRAVAFVPTR